MPHHILRGKTKINCFLDVSNHYIKKLFFKFKTQGILKLFIVCDNNQIYTEAYKDTLSILTWMKTRPRWLLIRSIN